jgi:excisionase family DNA binding protein
MRLCDVNQNKMNTVLTVEETAKFLRVHPSTVCRLLRARTSQAFKIGSDWRFNLESIERFISDRETVSGRHRPSGPSENQSREI